MISLGGQNELLTNIAKKLNRKITIYAIGGTAMMSLGLKSETLDIDLVFDTEEDRKAFKTAAEEIGFTKQDPIVIYGLNKKNKPEMLHLKGVRFDLFLNKVIHFIFSEKMKQRTEQTHYYEDKLTVKVANHNDILLMKCATDREKDKVDVKSILEIKGADWELITAEAENQLKLGATTALLDLGEFLEHLKHKMKLDIPKKVLDDVFRLLKQQVNKLEKKTKRK